MLSEAKNPVLEPDLEMLSAEIREAKVACVTLQLREAVTRKSVYTIGTKK